MKQRDRIKMTPEEVDEFLRGRHTMSVATVGPDGGVHLVAMWYGFLDGAPAFETYQKSQKVVNLRRDPRVCVTAEAVGSGGDVCGVTVQGRAEFLSDTSQRRALVERFHEKYRRLERLWNGTTMPASRVMFRIVPSRVRSWGLG